MVRFRQKALEASLHGDLEAEVQSGGIRLLLWTAAIAVSGVVVLLIPFEQVVVVPGSLRVVGGNAVVRSSASGVAKAVKVADGDLVTAGQVLVQLSTPELDAAVQKAEADAQRAAVTARPADAAALVEAQRRLQEGEGTLPLAQARVRRAKDRLASQQALAKEGLVPRQAVGAAEDEVDQAEADRTRVMQALSTARADVVSLQAKAGESGQVEATVLASLQLQTDRMAVKSDHAGRVEWIGVHPGEAVTVGQRLVRVAPGGENLPLEVVALLPVDRLGSLRAGLSARVAVDGYEVGDFGYGSASLAKVGRDPLSLDQQREVHPGVPADQVVVEGVLHPDTWGRLKPEAGMTVRVWVVLGRRSLLSRLLAKLG